MVCITSWICFKRIDQLFDLCSHERVQSGTEDLDFSGRKGPLEGKTHVWEALQNPLNEQQCVSMMIWLSFSWNDDWSKGEPHTADSKLNSQLPYLCRVGAKRSLAGCQEPGQNSGGGGLVDPQADNEALERDMVQSSPLGCKQTPGEILWRKRGSRLKSSSVSGMILRLLVMLKRLRRMCNMSACFI